MPVATLYSINSSQTLKFSILEWLNQASDEDILDVALIDFSCGVPTDFIAYYYENTNLEVETFLKEAQEGTPENIAMGFECRVNKEEALEWIKINRNHIFVKLNVF